MDAHQSQGGQKSKIDITAICQFQSSQKLDNKEIRKRNDMNWFGAILKKTSQCKIFARFIKLAHRLRNHLPEISEDR
jgi:hypothetical protein